MNIVNEIMGWNKSLIINLRNIFHLAAAAH